MKTAKHRILRTATWAVLFSTFLAASTVAQPEPEGLEARIMELDAVLFENGFNDCRLDQLSDIVADDLEFYHDTSGPTFGREPFLEAMRRNICTPTDAGKPTRRLIDGSTEIHPLYQNGQLYGAIQNGEHAFYLGRGSDAPKTSTARFTHLWLLSDGQWQLTRVLSYAHVVP